MTCYVSVSADRSSGFSVVMLLGAAGLHPRLMTGTRWTARSPGSPIVANGAILGPHLAGKLALACPIDVVWSPPRWLDYRQVGADLPVIPMSAETPSWSEPPVAPKLLHRVLVPGFAVRRAVTAQTTGNLIRHHIDQPGQCVGDPARQRDRCHRRSHVGRDRRLYTLMIVWDGSLASVTNETPSSWQSVKHSKSMK